MSKEQLLVAAKCSVKTETLATTEAIRHFSEISRRQFFLECGYATLFDMLTKYFGYCAGSAQIRINAMRLLRDVPEIETKISNGEVTLTTVSKLQTFFAAEKKAQKTYTQDEKMKLVDECIGKSTREVERELASKGPEPIKREVVRATSSTHSRVSLSLNNELLVKLEKLKGLLSCVNANMSFEELVERLVEMGLERLDPEAKANRASNSFHAHEMEKAPVQKRSRYIPAHARHATWKKNDGAGCEYVDSKSGTRCGSKHFLQIDHVLAFSKGGSHSTENLRILCGQHNRWIYKNQR